MDDYSWIDTWGLPSDMYSGGYSTGTMYGSNYDYWDGSDPYAELYKSTPAYGSEWYAGSYWDGSDPYGQLYQTKPEYGSEWYAGAYNPGGDLSSMSLSQLASLAGKVMGGQKTGNEMIDSLIGMVGGAAGLYGDLQNLDWMDMLSDTRGTYSDLLKKIKQYQPYTGKEVADLTEAQKQAMGYAPEMLSGGKQMWMGSGTYDPNQLQTYLNPYMEGGLAAANRLTSQNLMENVLPGINTTFTGQGQFGSTRNEEFQNRAIRDTQQAIADANAKAMVGAYGQASDDYMSMLKQQGQIGQQLFTGGTGLASAEQVQKQAELTGGLEAWKRNQMMPIEQFSKLTSGVGAFNPAGAGSANPLSALSSLFGGK